MAESNSTDPFEKLSKEANERKAGCEAQKREFDLDIREGYFFTDPHRSREIRSAQASSTSKPKDADTLQTGIGMEMAKDFVTVMHNAFMPQAEPWAERRAGMFVPEQLRKQIKDDVAKQDRIIFDAIRASNLYEELPKAWVPDLAIGTSALWIDDPRPAENIVVQAVPLHELEINVGPFGALDDRFAVRHTKNRHVKALLGSIYDKLSAEQRKPIEDKPDGATVIRWGFWRLWDRRDDVVWQHVVMVGDKVVHAVELVSEGCCPLIPMRFNPSPEWAFAAGPVIEALPDFRQMDELQAAKIEHVDLELRPPMGLPQDMISGESSFEVRKFYPVPNGTGTDIKRLIESGKIDGAIFITAEIERSLRHKFFLDWPDQRGKTPPTATQWIDEMQLAQRRLGTPGASFWKEGPAQIFLRFKYILEKRGLIEPIQVEGKTVSLEPYNPAQRAAEQQEVAMAARALQLFQAFPEEFRMAVDGTKTMENIRDKMRATLVAMRDPNQVDDFIGKIAQLADLRQRPGEPDAAGLGQQ